MWHKTLRLSFKDFDKFRSPVPFNNVQHGKASLWKENNESIKINFFRQSSCSYKHIQDTRIQFVELYSFNNILVYLYYEKVKV